MLNNLELQQISSIEQQKETIANTLLSLNSNLSASQAQIDAISETDGDSSKNISILTEKSNVAAEILTYENKKSEYENVLKGYDLQNGNCNIIADASGYISLNTEVKKGSFIQEGTSICKIFPEKTDGYYAEIYVENSDIAKLKEGQAVKFEISAYPSGDYGYFTGTINTISKDIKVDQNSGSAYYLVKVICDKSSITDKNGKTGNIMNGMACQAKVIVDEQSILKYLLEKIDLLG